jgi:hypothetical protein
MKTTLAALIATATVANATIVHLFENEDIKLRITVETHQINDYTDPDTGRELINHNSARFKVEICQTAAWVRLNSVYYRMNHGNLNGEWRNDPSMKEVDYFDSDWLDIANQFPSPNPEGQAGDFGFRPYLTPDQGRGSYDFTNQMLIGGENTNWFDENWDGGDSWLLYNEEDGSGSNSIGEWKFNQPLSIVYSTQMGSTTVVDGFENFTTPYVFAQGEDLFDTPAGADHNVPEPSAALLTILAALGTLRRKR